MASDEFDNLALMCATFQQRPSTVARPLLEPDLPPGLASELDWYAFDVAAASRYLQLKAEAERAAQDDGVADYGEHMPGAYRGRAQGDDPAPVAGKKNGPVVEGADGSLFMRGTEVLPSQRR